MKNSIFTIHPQLKRGVLMFNDPVRDIREEPFVSGADEILIHAARQAGHDPTHGFPLHFSATPFPNAMKAERIDRSGDGGAWYLVAGVEGWLCPVTLQYFGEYPERIYFNVPKHTTEAT